MKLTSLILSKRVESTSNKLKISYFRARVLAMLLEKAKLEEKPFKFEIKNYAK